MEDEIIWLSDGEEGVSKKVPKMSGFTCVFCSNLSTEGKEMGSIMCKCHTRNLRFSHFSTQFCK